MTVNRYDFERCKMLARKAAAEGCVLLQNENHVLPFAKGSHVAVFGRIQRNYYKSGAGSGGMVNAEYVVSILDGLKACENIEVDSQLEEIYRQWVERHPFDFGEGWAKEPRCQLEMPLEDAVASDAAARSDAALVILGRLAGEDFDHTPEQGSYYLNKTELEMLRTVRRHFHRMAVVLNTGNIIDLGWMDEIHPDALLMAWQGGQEGGNGVADVLAGIVNPSGRLCDTIAYTLKDYPSDANFGDAKKNIYAEDIYVGYRWFETFAPETVRYSFGFGLSYTTFSLHPEEMDEHTLQVTVTNTGSCAGREVVQIYVSQPAGELGKPSKILMGFEKTCLLQPGESETLRFPINWYRLASYDDSGKTGHRFCYVLESGQYAFFAGKDVRNVVTLGTIQLAETRVVSVCSQALAPVESFQRRTCTGWEPAPLREYSLAERIRQERPGCRLYTGDRGIKLLDVLEQRASMENFLAQLSDEDLICISRGEGMCSPKVTPGTGGAFGGVTDRLLSFGIPIACCTDGPSGIRMDSGAKAFSHPCGTLLACTFDKELNRDLFEMVGAEMAKHHIEVLLGPGINLHRHPLNGRNFEYFSEDPVLTGEMATAQLLGLHRQNVTACIKHFCANNQENHRHTSNSVISERALRELYLKGYEYAVKDGGADCIMTSYGAVNGLWTAGSYDLCTTILRGEWGFRGIVMTDWWADVNEENGKPAHENSAYMVRAQNDLYMVCESAQRNTNGDNILQKLKEGVITRGELVRNAANICNFVMRSLAMQRMLHPEQYQRQDEAPSAETGYFPEDVVFEPVTDGTQIDLCHLDSEKGQEQMIALTPQKQGNYRYTLHLSLNPQASSLAQIPVTMFMNGTAVATYVLHGNTGETIVYTGEIALNRPHIFLRFQFGKAGAKLHKIVFEMK